MNPKTLIIGASGQVGRELVTQMQQISPEKEILCTSRQPHPHWLTLDLAELASLEDVRRVLGNIALEEILCVGGMTYVDGCEAEPALAFRVNAAGPALLAEYARQQALPFAYFSTEYVFAGEASQPGPYLEDATTDPLSVYGRSKLEGESLILQHNPDALVIRTTVVYGFDSQAKNFIYTLMKTLGQGKPLHVPEDQVSTPTYSRDLAMATLALLRHRAHGIYHVTGPELLSRLDFARRIANFLGLDASLLNGVTTASLRQPAPRPLSAGLISGKLPVLYPELNMRPLHEALVDCESALRRFLDHARP